ncbi:hypothetical protein F4778DRAFT_491870 [Xylariomycetidae sp. FL2044]|nr:hypothetical protein F4778DRAFT_491870 [Xylariomycetidae sp. FL2044]
MMASSHDASAKRKRSISEHPARSLNDPHMGMGSHMSLLDDDGHGSDSDDFDRPAGRSEGLKVTEKKPDPPSKEDTRCRCRSANTKKVPCLNCACSKWGYKYDLSRCGCSHAYQNPFNKIAMEDIFRPQAASSSIVPHPCFVQWILKKRTTTLAQQRHPLTLEYLFGALYSCIWDQGEPEFTVSSWLEEWRAVKDSSDETPEHAARKLELMRRLVRYGLDEEGGSESYFSFCYVNPERGEEDDGGESKIGTWERYSKMRHCPDCGECVEECEWHCKQCNKCVYGSDTRCHGCEGVSSRYSGDGDVDGDSPDWQSW